jgi:hypothetical protein
LQESNQKKGSRFWPSKQPLSVHETKALIDLIKAGFDTVKARTVVNESLLDLSQIDALARDNSELKRKLKAASAILMPVSGHDIAVAPGCVYD